MIPLENEIFIQIQTFHQLIEDFVDCPDKGKGGKEAGKVLSFDGASFSALAVSH